MNDSPPPLHPAAPYIFPPESKPSTSMDKAQKKRGSEYIPCPPNAFILFRASFVKNKHITQDVEKNHSALSKIIGMTWRNLPEVERQAWHVKAKEEYENHRCKWPKYKFKRHTCSKTPKKKRATQVSGDTKRWEKIAELLCDVKKGKELKHALNDFDKINSRDLTVRFESPLTAHLNCWSSSGPVQPIASKQPFKQSSPLPRKRPTNVAAADLTTLVETESTSGSAQFEPPLPLDYSLYTSYISVSPLSFISPTLLDWFSDLKPHWQNRISASLVLPSICSQERLLPQ